MSAKHTPGPWRVSKDVLRDNSIPVTADGRSKDSLHVAHCLEMMHINEREANARLIALAPELAEALRDMVDLFGVPDTRPEALREDESECVKRARALLHRIEGKP